MGITQKIENEAGVPVEYWRIREFQAVNIEGNFQLALTVEGYLSADTRKKGKLPVEERVVTLEVPAAEKIGSKSLTDYLYARLKKLDEFKGAVNKRVKMSKPKKEDAEEIDPIDLIATEPEKE